MWWHGDVEEVARFSDGRLSPQSRPEDLYSAMGFSRVAIRKEADGDESPVAELIFNAVFEQEHGVGVLTDGKEVLGTGYIDEASPFGSVVRTATPAERAKSRELQAAAAAEHERWKQQQMEIEAAKDAAITDKRCPFCGKPCPSYRKTCKYCGQAVAGPR
jgi:hypothetical protein